MTRPQFGLMTHCYYWAFVALVLGAPLAYVFANGVSRPIPVTSFGLAVMLSLFAGLLLWASHRQCSTERMTYREGMLFITGSMMTGWTYLSLLVVFPALLGTFLVVGIYALCSLAKSDSDWAQARFHRVVGFCYRNRMRQ